MVYDGIWVGENSKVANVQGVRKNLVDALRRIKSPVIRWPGGCFADGYDWKDGVGPAAQRPRRTNFWAGEQLVGDQGNIPQKYDPNQFGTNEFAHFCKLAGSEPYLAANLRSLPVEDFYRWIEYCNSPAGSTTLADLRAAVKAETQEADRRAQSGTLAVVLLGDDRACKCRCRLGWS